MSKIERFEDLKCWQEARVLVKQVYLLSRRGEIARDFDMRGQIRRAALSSMSNVAEGFGRFSDRDFTRFLEMSFTSANEVKSISYAALDIGYLTEGEIKSIQDKAEHVKALDLGLIRYLNSTKRKRKGP